MRDLKLWTAATLLEAILMTLYVSRESGHQSLADGLWTLATQLPSAPLSNLLLPEAAPEFWFYVLTFALQTVFFSMVLHLGKFVKSKVTNASNARPEPPK